VLVGEKVGGNERKTGKIHSAVNITREYKQKARKAGKSAK
jgi:hypothetical protein